MKILLSIFILIIPSFLSGEMVCKSLSGCRVVWETGKCIGCVEQEYEEEKVVEKYVSNTRIRIDRQRLLGLTYYDEDGIEHDHSCEHCCFHRIENWE
jgi:hypothetical protein